MARWNQFAGRRPEAWWGRYNERFETAQKQVAALQVKGLAIKLNQPQKIGGPGVPGGCRNLITAELESKIIGRKQIRNLCITTGVKLNNHSQPV